MCPAHLIIRERPDQTGPKLLIARYKKQEVNSDHVLFLTRTTSNLLRLQSDEVCEIAKLTPLNLNSSVQLSLNLWHWQGNMLWLTRDYRLSKHHIRHIKAYDPNEGKVRLLMTETRTKNISFLHKKAFIQTFFTLLTQHIYFRTMRGVWPGFTRLRVFTTSAPGWPTGAAASGERTCGVKPKH